MKNDRHGKAKILTQSEIQLLFSQSFHEERDRALFGITHFPIYNLELILLGQDIPIS